MWLLLWRFPRVSTVECVRKVRNTTLGDIEPNYWLQINAMGVRYAYDVSRSVGDGVLKHRMAAVVESL